MSDIVFALALLLIVILFASVLLVIFRKRPVKSAVSKHNAGLTPPNLTPSDQLTSPRLVYPSTSVSGGVTTPSYDPMSTHEIGDPFEDEADYVSSNERDELNDEENVGYWTFGNREFEPIPALEHFGE